MYGAAVHGIIPRPDLMKKMKKIPAGKNIFITAPGGYGKTTAAHQWLSSVDGQTAKLRCTMDDNDPGIFYRRLAYVLLKFAGKERTVPDSVFTPNVFLEMIDLLPPRQKRCYLLLDDMHNIKNADIIRFIPVIAMRLPKYVRLCLTGRGEPTEALLQTGLFEVLGQDDLVFSPEEVEWLGAEKDRDLTEKQIRDLLKTTGGWAIYISALLTGAGSYKTAQTLTQYFETKVWGLWDRALQKNLLRLAIPSEVTPALCERLTGEADGTAALERLIKEENAFLSCVADDTYRFHDIFRDFLLDHSALLGAEEVRRLNDVVAGWYYERGDYYAGTRYYIYNADHDGIDRCMNEINRFQDRGTMSIETRSNFTNQYILGLPDDFIANSPVLISKCAAAAHSSGDVAMFAHYADMLYQKLPEIAAKQPDLIETIGFSIGIDYRYSFREYVMRVTQMLPLMAQAAGAGRDTRINSITQNLPFYHRSMRDFSEYHEMKGDDFALIRAAFGVIIGRDYDVQERATYAGLHYERGELLEAARHALDGFHMCDENMSPETVFCSQMILSAVLHAMGAKADAVRIMERAECFIKERAPFLQGNFRALQTERAIYTGDVAAAREWLDIHMYEGSQLPFYLICQHFATLRSLIALKEYAQAVDFGGRLAILAAEYKRPLDEIESTLLTALALWKKGDQKAALGQITRSMQIAQPYGFTQLFVNEGREILPILLSLRGDEKSGAVAQFADRLLAMISGHQTDEAVVKPLKLPAMRQKMLAFLERGLTYNEIAEATGLKHGSVKTHVLLLYKQLGVHNAQDAITKAKMLGVME